MDSQKRNMYLLMTALVFSWGLEYIFAKRALAIMDSLTLLFFKYAIGLVVVLIIKLKLDGGELIRKKDIPIFLACSLVGEVGYFFLEYTSITYLPVALVTIILALVPVLSILIDKVVLKKRATRKMVVGVLLSMIGVAMVIGVDYRSLFQGRIIGYLTAIAAVISWNIYNFMTASLHDRYKTASLTLNQLICTCLLVLPYAVHHLPAPGSVTVSLTVQILYLGIISTGFCFLIQVRGLHVLGPTVSAMFSNFLPITTTFFGWLILKETILPFQMAGGALVIAAGYIVIKEKGRLEELSDGATTDEHDPAD